MLDDMRAGDRAIRDCTGKQVLLDVSLSGRVFESPVSVMEVGLLGLWAGRKEVGNGELLTIVPSSGRARQYYREKRDW